MTRVGVVSDTHGLLELTRRVMAVFAEAGVERILHCGDIGTPAVVEALSALPVDYVYGNCDGTSTRLAEAVKTYGGTLHGKSGEVEIDGRHVALYHGQDEELLDTLARSGQWDLICTGHTHRSGFSELYGTRILNPGALQRRWEAPGAAIVDFPKIDVTFFRVG